MAPGSGHPTPYFSWAPLLHGWHCWTSWKIGCLLKGFPQLYVDLPAMGFGHFYSDKSADQEVDKKRSLPSQNLLIPHQTLQVKYKGSRQA